MAFYTAQEAGLHPDRPLAMVAGPGLRRSGSSGLRGSNHQISRFPSKGTSKYISPKHTEWRKQVLERDGNKCVDCGATEKLEADHIKPQAHYPEFRYSLENGRTLCKPCHIKTETYGGRVHRIVRVSIEAI